MMATNNKRTESSSESESLDEYPRNLGRKSYIKKNVVTRQTVVEGIDVKTKLRRSQTPQQKNNGKKFWWSYGVRLGLAALIALIAIAVKFMDISMYLSSSCKINEPQEKFRRQSRNIWGAVKESMENKELISRSFVFLHKPEDADTATCLARNIAGNFLCQRKHRSNFSFISPEDLEDVDDYGILLNRYKNTVHNAVVVKNLNQVSSRAAEIFHSLCDDTMEINAPSLCIFTITSHKILTDRPWTVAREILSEVWSDMADNILDPLLSRIIGKAFIVTAEDITACDV